MTRLVAIDPGKAHAGIAVFDDGNLVSALRISGIDQASLFRLSGIVGVWLLEADHVALELMVPRATDRGMRAAVLIDVATSGAFLAGRASKRGDVSLVRPSDWKGSIPKPKRKAPYLVEVRCRARLSAEEVRNVDVPSDWRHAMDVWDAVGIGLHVLGRGILLPPPAPGRTATAP